MEERGRRACEVDVCCLQRNHSTPPPFFVLGSGLVRSDIVLFSVCEVKSFDIPLVPSLESVLEEEPDTLQHQPNEGQPLGGFKGQAAN